ncbi:MAG TPA: ABC transporter permease, partial [Vicinamibacterales bacterium]|nr:ABC transporter permease [Vicinamibacterales bacterium]
MCVQRGSMLQDYKLGLRMLLKYPGLTLAGGLALAIAIGIGAVWYDVSGKILSPTIPLPEGDRLVEIATHNALTNQPEPRVARDFLEWRRGLHTIENLGAFRTDTRNLAVGNGAPQPVQIAQLTAAAFGSARVPPLLGRALLDSDDMPGAPSVVVLGYDAWQRVTAGRPDVVGSVVRLGNTATTVIGVMPQGFEYPVNHDAWTPLSLRATHESLSGGAIGVIGRLAPGASREQANAELRVFGERTAAALPATHQHLRPRVVPLGGDSEIPQGMAQFASRNLPILLVLSIACLTVGTLVYARTATREGEIAVRSALGASRARIVGQLFVEALVLASVATAVGLLAADRVVTWGVENIGDAPFWVTPGLRVSTIVYAGGLAVVSAAMLSLLPALRATRTRLQPQLANRGGGATLRFGRVWTGAMIAQVALTAMGIPAAMESASQAIHKLTIRAEFPSQGYLAAHIDLDRPFDEEATPASEQRRAQTFAALERRLAQQPGVVAVTFADRAPGEGAPRRGRVADVELSPGAGPAFDYGFQTSAVGPEFFETYELPVLLGRAFHAGDHSPDARAVLVNEAFVRGFRSRGGSGSPIGARLRYPESSAQPGASTTPWYDIVGVVRDLGLDPDDAGDEQPFVFHAAAPGALSPLVMTVRVRGNPATLAARLPVIAADVDAALYIREARPLETLIRERDNTLSTEAAA